MNDKLHRGWFSFSLRTMFVLMTLFCCWLGWESSIVRHRKSTLKELRANPTYQVLAAEEWKRIFPTGGPAAKLATVALYRRLLGDEAVQEISYTAGDREPAAEEVQRISRVFPEANVSRRELLMEPCHPGCFPKGTFVETPGGQRRIETIEEGSSVLVYVDGELHAGTVQTVFITTNRLWRVETEDGSLLTTQTQPLCLAQGTIKPAGDLKGGDEILCWRAGAPLPDRVKSVAPTGRTERVYNLILGDSEVFIAGGFLARSKPPALAAE